MRIVLNNTIDDYRLFLKVKQLPQYSFQGRTAIVPDEYGERLGKTVKLTKAKPYKPSPFLFDYQRDIAAMCIEKRRFCVFADCGLGKTLIFLEFAKHVRDVLPEHKCILIISPLMVIRQTLDECERWYGDTLPIRQVSAAELPGWLRKPDARIGITNFEALTQDVTRGQLGCLIVDESSMLKSHYGKWGQVILRLGAGLEWKYAGSGTPAPNDRIEYANHAMFMGAFPTVNAFLARYFVNRGQTQERWSLKPHALAPFYRSLSHWSIFLTNPATYGWHDNAEGIPPIHVHIDDVPLTQEQHQAVGELTGELIPTHAGGIGMRSKLGQIAKGRYNGRAISTNKPAFIRKLVDSWPGEGTIIWCLYNAEQELMEATFPEAGSISGATPHEERMRLIDEFKAQRRRILITKPRILGYGLNLHVATRQVFSGLQDSYESFYQAVKRSNRVGSTRALNVHIPVTAAERPMVENVLRKAHRVTADTEEQERIFHAHRTD